MNTLKIHKNKPTSRLTNIKPTVCGLGLFNSERITNRWEKVTCERCLDKRGK